MANAYVHPTAIVESNVTLGENTQVWHFAHLREGVRLGDDVLIAKDCFIDRDVEIRRGVRIQNGVSVYRGVSLGDWCFVGPHVIFTNDLSPRAGNLSWEIKETHIECGASIGAGAVILCGITLGAFSMTGAGAIVSKDVPPFTLVAGVPAQPVKRVCGCGKTHAPLDTPISTLLGKCCRETMRPEVYSLAERTIRDLTAGQSS